MKKCLLIGTVSQVSDVIWFLYGEGDKMAFTCTKMSKTITLKNNMEMQWTYENQTFKNEWKLSVGIDKITKNISLSYFESSLQISTYLDIYPVNDMQYIYMSTYPSCSLYQRPLRDEPCSCTGDLEKLDRFPEFELEHKTVGIWK